ncbi:MAG TPA: MBL fold metallo-hydrolase [Stellaceae bacterium]|nr:MBL fold metallo-hydrolase [Stellaceae bacterium]
MRQRHPDNAPGDWYVDRDCIDCGASRIVAPGLIVHHREQCVFQRQPETEEELVLAWRARLLCPTASVRSESPAHPPPGIFPEAMTDGVWRLGFNARSSWGAHSFLMRRPDGNVMVDSPRWASQLVETITDWGGLSDILLTHRDDVADAERYAKEFGARVWIHEADRGAAPYATNFLRGREPAPIAPGLLAIPVPGHTKGSVAFLLEERCLFTGDTLSWELETGDFRASRAVCWWSWPEQVASLGRLPGHRFEWIFAGHGGSHHLPADEMAARLGAFVRRLKEAA